TFLSVSLTFLNQSSFSLNLTFSNQLSLLGTLNLDLILPLTELRFILRSRSSEGSFAYLLISNDFSSSCATAPLGPRATAELDTPLINSVIAITNTSSANTTLVNSTARCCREFIGKPPSVLKALGSGVRS